MKPYVWPGVLAGTGIVLGVVLTCIAPFVAVAVLAARTLSLRAAFAVVTAMWLGNQAIGFSFEHFPLDFWTFAWGVVILVATCAAVVVARSLPVTPLAFVAAFAAFEGLQLAYALSIGDAANFAPAIDAQVFAGNVLGIAILAAIRLVMTGGSRAATRRSIV
ncbi:MAG: hypothetical protein NVS3B16_05560 [Vulcanimicrobiaceae bacterium]